MAIRKLSPRVAMQLARDPKAMGYPTPARDRGFVKAIERGKASKRK